MHVDAATTIDILALSVQHSSYTPHQRMYFLPTGGVERQGAGGRVSAVLGEAHRPLT